MKESTAMDTTDSVIRLPGLKGRTAVITGAGGAICGAIAKALGRAGCKIAIWDIKLESAKATVDSISAAGGPALACRCDASIRADVERATRETLDAFGGIDILINGVGGGYKSATTAPDLAFFDITAEDMKGAFGLNYMATVIPSQVVGKRFADQKRGVILNIASLGGVRPLTRAIGYCNAKAAVVNFTQWLAVHMAREYSPQIRVNALAPGFVLTDQNRFLLVDEKTGRPTARGKLVAEQVPMGRYAEPDEMVGAALWLVSDAASFVTGAVIPVDGGLLASAGV
jgi:NAD(P)-dependent dehydrogenase (short-subunit alcohol dehydrogenase family)